MAQRLRAIVLLMILLGVTFAAAPAALANSAPPRTSGDKTGVILPGSSSQVHIRRETLQFELKEGLATALVTARYEMENQGAALERFPVIFVTQERGKGEIKASWNGQPLSVRPVETASLSTAQAEEMNRAWTAMEVTFDPVSGKRLRAQDWYGGGNQVQYYRFELNLPAGARGTLEVQYDHQAYRDAKLRVNTTYHYQYLLLPAKGWASFGPLEISVKAPGPEGAYFASSLPMNYQDGAYRASLPGLPEENLGFSLMSREGMLFNWTTTGPYYMLIAAITLAVSLLLGLGFGWLSGLIRSRGWAIGVAIVLGLVAGGMVQLMLIFGVTDSFTVLHQPGYGSLFVGLLLWLLSLPVMTILAAIYASRLSARRAAQYHA